MDLTSGVNFTTAPKKLVGHKMAPLRSARRDGAFFFRCDARHNRLRSQRVFSGTKSG